MSDIDRSFENDVLSASASAKICSYPGCGKRLSTHNKIGRCFHHPDPEAERKSLEREAIAAAAAEKRAQKERLTPQVKAKDPTVGLTPGHVGVITHADGSKTNPVPRGRKGYLTQRKRMLELLAGEEKKLFDELIALGREEALYAARYFSLNGEPEKTHDELIAEGAFPYIGTVSWGVVCASAVIHYLDPVFPASKQTAMHAQSMNRWVLKQRDVLADTEERRRRHEEVTTKVQALGISQLPEGMPERYFDFYLELAQAWSRNKFAELSKHARVASVIGTRWGFEDGNFYTLEEIAGVEQITRERVRQLEVQALKLLNVLAKPSET